jgi:hypothetical protein
MPGKEGAFRFLVGLSEFLNEHLPGPDNIRAEVNRRWNKPAHERTCEDKLACKENLFLYHFALPLIFEYVRNSTGMNKGEIVRSMRGEYHAKFPQLLSSNARRSQGHPFGKSHTKNPADIMAKWRAQQVNPLNQAYPDLCITAPFPYSIVFDAKFCDAGNATSAERALVSGVYEAVFYRGLPRSLSRPPSPSAWDYEYGCLLAYDASPGSYLRRAWDSVASKSLFWEDANVFVMILRGNE